MSNFKAANLLLHGNFESLYLTRSFELDDRFKLWIFERRGCIEWQVGECLRQSQLHMLIFGLAGCLAKSDTVKMVAV